MGIRGWGKEKRVWGVGGKFKGELANFRVNKKGHFGNYQGALLLVEMALRKKSENPHKI